MTSAQSQDVDILKRELLGLFKHIQRMRLEIASIRRPGVADEEDRFSTMTDELDAIVDATETATDTIMGTVEEMEGMVTTVQSAVAGNDEATTLLNGFPDMSGRIFEACAFQDITGQRISKVVNSLQFIEGRVNALISMWGPETLSALEDVKGERDGDDEDRKYLNGPQLSGQGIDQNFVDSMFDGGPAAPKAAASAAPAPKTAAPAPKSAAASAQQSAPKSASKPAAKSAPAEDEDVPALGQGDIDKLFG